MIVRTVRGDWLPGAASPGPRWDYHEHLFQVSPLLAGDELDDEELSGAEARSLARSGISAMIEATPIGLGRRPAAVARISARTGLVIVHVSGAHRQEHYPAGHWLPDCSESELAAMFTADIARAMPSSDRPSGWSGVPIARGPDGVPVRAGLLKLGIGYWRISRFERRVAAAIGTTHRRTGVAVMVHLEHGSAATEILDLLGAEGVPSDRVVLAHVDRNLDAGWQLELAERGAYLGYDGIGRHREAPDSALLDCLAQVVDAGGGARLLLGGDVARRTRYHAYGGMPGLRYLADRFLPRLEAVIGPAALALILQDNPIRLLAFGGTATDDAQRDP